MLDFRCEVKHFFCCFVWYICNQKNDDSTQTCLFAFYGLIASQIIESYKKSKC